MVVSIIFFNKKRLSKEYVDLSIGRVYFYELTNGIRNKVYKKSVLNENLANKPKFFNLFEKELIPLNKRKISNLSIKDGDLLRSKVRDILIDNNIILKKEKVKKESDVADIFSKKDIEWFNNTLNKQMSTIKNRGRK